MFSKLRVVAIVVAVLIVIVLIVPFLIPVNKFRPVIEEKATAAVGRKVQIGDLRLSLLTGSISATDLSIADDPQFSQTPFLTAKSLKIGVEMIPLIFSRALNITSVAIVNPDVTILQNPAGEWNYSSMGSSSASARAPNTPEPSQGAAKPPAFAVNKINLTDGRVSIGSTKLPDRTVFDHVNIAVSNFSAASKFNVTVACDLPGGGKLAVDGDAGPLNQANAALTPLAASISIENPVLTLVQQQDSGWNVSLGALSSASSPTQQADREPPSKQTALSTNALTIRKFDLKNGRVVVSPKGSAKASTYQNVNVTATGVSATTKSPITVSADLPAGGKFKLDGSAGPLNQTNAMLTPLSAKIDVSALNLASSGFVDSSLGLGGIVDVSATAQSQDGQVAANGTLKLSKALLVAGGTPAAVPASVDFTTTYDLRSSAGVLSSSTIKIGKAEAHLAGTYKTQGDAMVVALKLDADKMPASDLQAFLPAVGVNLPKGASLDSGDLTAHLQMQGPTSKLATDGNVGLFNAKLAKFDLGSKMSAVSALTGIKTGSDLIIEKFTSNLHVSPAGIRADQVNATIPALGIVTGSGTVDEKNNLDFKMAAAVTAGGATPLGAINTALGKYVNGGKDCKGGVSIPFLIQGTTSDPKFVPNVGGVASALLSSGSCGGTTATTGEKPQTPADLVNGLSGLFGKKKK